MNYNYTFSLFSLLLLRSALQMFSAKPKKGAFEGVVTLFFQFEQKIQENTTILLKKLVDTLLTQTGLLKKRQFKKRKHFVKTVVGDFQNALK